MIENKSFWIEFIGDRSVKVEAGQTILSASLEAGISHYHACGGKAQCSTCRVLVKEGYNFLSEINGKEKALREKIQLPPNVRLACQTFVKGVPVRVHRIIRDETDIELYIEQSGEIKTQEIGEEKELVLFFLDIRNFTHFLETHLPFDVIHIVRRLFQLFRLAIEANRGSIIETAGDGLYAVFGLESDVTEGAHDALHAGIRIQEELKCFNEQYLEKNFNHHVEIGIGAHSGKVIVGNVGLGVNNNLSVMGLAVNIASRLQSATRELNNNFIVSAELFALLENKPAFKETTISLKGIKDSFNVVLIGSPFN